MAKWWKRALGLQGRERATALVTQGVVHAREGRLDDARRSYEAAVDADETLAVAWLNLGLCRLDLYNRALARAVDDDGRIEDRRSPDRSEGDSRAADERARSGEDRRDARPVDKRIGPAALDDIAAPLSRALAIDGSSIVGWRALAHVEERRAQWGKADDAWAQVERAAAPPPPDAARTPAEDLRLADNARVLQEARDARRSLAKRAAADRAQKRALRALDADVGGDEKRAALAELLAFVDEPELLVRGHALAGSLARRAGERAQAKALLERAAAADRSDVDTLRELASICLEEGDLRRALAASIDAYRERPTDGGLVCNVGVCHLGLGDVDKAAEFIELAHQLEPKDPIVLRAKDALQKARSPR